MPQGATGSHRVKNVSTTQVSVDTWNDHGWKPHDRNKFSPDCARSTSLSSPSKIHIILCHWRVWYSSNHLILSHFHVLGRSHFRFFIYTSLTDTVDILSVLVGGWKRAEIPYVNNILGKWCIFLPNQPRNHFFDDRTSPNPIPICSKPTVHVSTPTAPQIDRDRPFVPECCICVYDSSSNCYLFLELL